MKKYDYIIIGAGVTGITLCKQLRKKGVQDILVLEKLGEYGGLCRTKNINGHILDIGGGHFFNSKHDDVNEMVFGLLPEEEFNYYPRVSKIEIGDETIDYPIESNIWQMKREKQIEYIISVIRNGEASGQAEPRNYEEWIRWRLGDKICDEYMIPYNKKLWGVEPKEMDVDWLYKIPQVNVNEILNYCLDRCQDVNKFPAHINFYYPKHGGFQRIVDALAEDEKPYMVFNEEVVKLEYKNNHWEINGKYSAENVVNTTPWCDLYGALGCPEELKEAFDNIRYNKIVVSLHEAHYEKDWHWRYIPDISKKHHREFYIHNFAEDSKPDGVYTETGNNRYVAQDDIFEGTKSIYSVLTDAAYPIPVIGHAASIKKILDHYSDKKLFGVGRWGQHQYQNADVSMHEAIKFSEKV